MTDFERRLAQAQENTVVEDLVTYTPKTSPVGSSSEEDIANDHIEMAAAYAFMVSAFVHSTYLDDTPTFRSRLIHRTLYRFHDAAQKGTIGRVFKDVYGRDMKKMVDATVKSVEIKLREAEAEAHEFKNTSVEQL